MNDASRQAELLAKRDLAGNGNGVWTFNDSTDLMRLQRTAQLKKQADVEQDMKTERRAYDPNLTNFHD